MQAASRHGYRPDIDGLRAIAVLPVVLFHAGVRAVPGGYVGVDVFFVISGFLITGILLREMHSGHYSIAEFYRRRARRIFPALAAMTLATILAGLIFLPPAELAKVSRSALWLVPFASNFFFWKSVSYFDAGSLFQPLLHTWSLAVEEQYYVFFPIVPWLLLKRDRLFVPALIAIAVISFSLSIYLIATRPSAAFYLLPSRAWELMLGGILSADVLKAPKSVRSASLASWVGLALILGPMLLYTDRTPFPGVAAVPPVVGTVLVIWAHGFGAGRLLSMRPVVSVGLASYSIYLWHLPIIEFTKYLYGGTLPAMAAALTCLASLAIGYGSLHFVERPFRVSGASTQAARRTMVAFATLPAIAIAGWTVVALDGVPERFSPHVAKIIDVANDERRHPRSCLSVDTIWVDPATPCKLGDQTAAPSTILWGDSHAMVTATAMAKAAKAHQASFLFAADADCPIGEDLGVSQASSPGLTSQLSYRRCGDYNAGMLERALRADIRTVVLSSRWTNWRIGEPPNPTESSADLRLTSGSRTASSPKENVAMFEDAFSKLVATLLQQGKAVVIVGPVPEPAYNVPGRVFVSRFGLAPTVSPIPLESYFARHRRILTIFAHLPSSPNLTFVWPASALCDQTSCPVTTGGLPLYFDHNHLSVQGAELTSPLYDKMFAGHPTSSLTRSGPRCLTARHGDPSCA